MAPPDFLWLWILLIAVGAVVVILALWWVHAYNRFIRLANDIEEADSTIEVFQKKRFDLVPNLVSTVEGYTKHETDVLEDVTAARTRVANAATPAERARGEQQLDQSLGRLFAVAEAYPDLKANTNFLQLQSQLDQIESEIASARRYYNANVKLYNTQLQTWPSRVIAERHGFSRKPLFEASAEEQQNVHVSF